MVAGRTHCQYQQVTPRKTTEVFAFPIIITAAAAVAPRSNSSPWSANGHQSELVRICTLGACEIFCCRFRFPGLCSVAEQFVAGHVKQGPAKGCFQGNEQRNGNRRGKRPGANW